MPRSLCAAQRGGHHCPNGIIIAARGGLVNAEHAAHPLCQGALCGAFRPAKAGRNAAGRGRRGAARPESSRAAFYFSCLSKVVSLMMKRGRCFVSL